MIHITSAANIIFYIIVSMRCFYVMRHGESEANVQLIISSDPEISTKTHGLTELGKCQVQSSSLKLIEDLKYFDDIYIYHSDFLRTKMTAEILKSAINEQIGDKLKYFGPDIRLRERYFGDYNGDHDNFYDVVWDHDQNLDVMDPPPRGVETCASVAYRGTELMRDHVQEHELNKTHKEAIIMVCHGDVASIMTAHHTLKVNPRLHCIKVEPRFEKAEYRTICQLEQNEIVNLNIIQ